MTSEAPKDEKVYTATDPDPEALIQKVETNVELPPDATVTDALGAITAAGAQITPPPAR